MPGINQLWTSIVSGIDPEYSANSVMVKKLFMTTPLHYFL
jgi:hypothetical protein